MTAPSEIQHVSDTAFWMASYRARETERKDALFRDPLAKLLIGERGQRISESMSATARYSYWTLVIRTILIDELIQKYVREGYATVVNLGAGLDTRPYRLELPPSVRWVELDFPAIVDLKNEKLKQETPRCPLERIAVDLANPRERARVFRELNDRIGPAILLTEGVIPYLSEEVVRDLATSLREVPNFKLWISEYYSPKLYPRFQSAGFRKKLGDSPFRFFPTDWFAVFESCGWTKKELRYLYDEGERAGRPFPLPWPVSWLRWVIGSEAMARGTRLQAYVVFQK